jgi:predicted enzyme related to lactoylglutathione lyase
MSRVVHFEIHAENPERAIKFYSTLFGWEFTKWNGPMEYWTIKTGPDSQPGINGGLVRRRGTIDGQAVIAYVCTVDTSSVDNAVKTITANGGTIALPKMPIPGIGWLAYGKDTEGNIFGVMQRDETAR